MDPRLVQLSRMLGVPLETPAKARAAVAASPMQLAEALVLEASASDDVTSPSSAADYLETRLTYLGDLVPPDAVPAIRDHFARATANW